MDPEPIRPVGDDVVELPEHGQIQVVVEILGDELARLPGMDQVDPDVAPAPAARRQDTLKRGARASAPFQAGLGG
jgi:hypothetical protein